MSARDIDLQSALAQIGSSSATERKEGLSNLEHLFKYNRNSHVIDAFKDRTWHEIYEALFSCASVERSAYLKASHSQKAKTAATTRLTACGKALRITVTAGVRRIRAKTTKAVVDHILQTLPTTEGPYCPGLALDYVKSLRIILEYQPHVEHSRDLWQEVLDFCLEGLAPLKTDHEDEYDSGLEPSATAGASIRTTSISLTRRSRATTPQGRRVDRASMFRPEVDDLIACMHQLVRATNAPVATNELNVVEAMQTFLNLSDSVRSSYNEAFGAINAVLAKTAASSLELTHTIILGLVPLIKNLWSAKSPSLKDEMLISLVLTKDHVAALVNNTAQATLRIELENLLEALQIDYSKRMERDQMQMADLVLDCSSSAYGKSILRLPTFALRKGRKYAESAWSLVYLIAAYTAALDTKKAALQGMATANGDHAPPKRTRLTTLLYQDMLRHGSSSPTPATRIANLQYLCFMFQLRPFSKEEVVEVLDTLAGCMSDQNSNVGRWAVLALASLATQSSSGKEHLKSQWLAIVPQVARLLTVDQCSRAASYFLYVLLKLRVLTYGDVATINSSMLNSLELQGPTSSTDASLALLGWIMDAQAAENPSTTTSTAELMIQWLFQKWSPSKFEDRETAAHISSSSRPSDIIQFFGKCKGARTSVKSSSPMLCGPIAQAWSVLISAEELINYLLLQEKEDFLAAPVADLDVPVNASTNRTALSITIHVLDGLEFETSRTLKAWEDVAAEKPQSLLPSMFITVLGLIVVNSALTSQSDDRASKRIDSLRKKNDGLAKLVFDVLASPECEIEKVDVALVALADYLPTLSTQIDAEDFPNDFTSLCVQINSTLQRRQHGRTAAAISEDDMDIDLDFESQRSEVVNTGQVDGHARDLNNLSTDQSSFRQQIITQTYLITALLKSSVDDGGSAGLATPLVAYLMDLSPQELFASRGTFLDVLLGCSILKIDDLEEMFNQLASFLEVYEYSRHEVALLLHVDLLRGCIAAWTDTENDGLNDAAVQAFEWFIDSALAHDLCSTTVKIGLVNLFLEIFKRRGPDYKAWPEASSIRTTLFKMLNSNDASVLHRLIRQLPDVFNQFTLETHEDVFNDIHSQSMYSEEWLEGNALRMAMFSALGARWNTLVRRSIYHIFEGAGILPQISTYARRCLDQLAKIIHLPDSQALFRLFAGQMLYTWLREESGSWDNIPFNIFGYSSLQALLFDVREEVYAQNLMLNDPNELAKNAERIGLGQSDLARHSFARSMAYGLSWDTELKSKRQAEKDRSETRLRGLIGQGYSAACRNHLAKALGILLLRTNFEKKQQKKHDPRKAQESGSNGQNSEEADKEVAESILEKRISNETAAKRDAKFETEALRAYKNMRNISSSDMRLPDPQQPIFRSRAFLDVADRLARRAKSSLRSLFEPAVYVFVLRLLLSNLYESLGSLHACLIVRKIRVLVALSGQSVLSGYALEISLHSLRPLLTDKQCAEDTLGIVQYLYSNGVDYLKQEMSFVAGMNVTTLISLRKFVGASQESTTQESQHRATIDRANSFRKWLVESWSKKFAEGMTDSSTLHTYMNMISYAFGANPTASAVMEKKESGLLQQLLEDRRSGRCLLPSATWNLAISLLCQSFELPSSYREDIFGLDRQARNYAADVWASCKGTETSPEYLQWAARVLGRARSAFGLDTASLHEGRRSLIPTEGEIEESSIKAIVMPVTDLLLAGDRAHAGLAEETLRSMLLRTNGYIDVFTEMQEILPTTVIQGLALMTEDVVVPVAEAIQVPLEDCFPAENVPLYRLWLQQLTTSLIAIDVDAPVVGCLQRIVTGIPDITETLFAPILHLVLEQDVNTGGAVRAVLSQMFQAWFVAPPPASTFHLRAILHALLFLRKQPYPQETTHADRLKWLEIDYTLASRAAERVGMHTAALLLAELSSFMLPTKSARRSTTHLAAAVDEETMLEIFRNIDDPDSFYGVQQAPSLDLVLGRLDHEADGFKGLMFRGAQIDSQLRMRRDLTTTDNAGLVKSLIGTNMNAIAYNLLAGRKGTTNTSDMAESVLKTAMTLEQWDIRVPDTSTSDTATLYRVFQSMNNATSITTIRNDLDAGLLQTMKGMLEPSIVERALRSKASTLGVLTELDDMVTAMSTEQLQNAWENIRSHSTALLSSQLSDVKTILSSREIFMNTLSNNASLREAMRVSIQDTRRMQVDALLSSCDVWKRRHGAQNSLETVTCLADLVPGCSSVGVDITTVAQNAASDVLWAQGEYQTSIRMLQVLVEGREPKDASKSAPRSLLLAKLGHHVGEARLEPSNQIISKYMEPAIKELKDATGSTAGQVHHFFASFCYEQLLNPENINDVERASKIKARRQAEVDAVSAEIKGMRSQTERKIRDSELTKARRWLRLEKAELDRLLKIREKFTEQCLENYMLALTVSDEHDNDALRFYAIWLEHADSDLANTVVGRNLDKVASHKFVRLMNQLSSRMQADKTLFHGLLRNLVLRICKEHPFHGMHYITAGTHNPGTSQEASVSRQKAAKEIAIQLKNDRNLGRLWDCMYKSDRLYHDVARYTDEEVARQGKEIRLDKVQPTKRLQENISKLQTPPPTLSIPLRMDLDYNKVPRVLEFQPTMRVAGGLSAPKIITSKLNDGSRFKQLFKGGNDDLRQDAIMEQVFEEVSKLLANHTSTRQRKLRIRTYNVLPLSNHSGVLEFAQNTMAFQDLLVPLHQTYHPKDLKSSACRTKISDAARNTTEERIKVYKNVCQQFQPAMRYFFFERFSDPDAWFEKRLAYTRSTAAMSILGHVIGLGDRHLHNILLDYVTGEVVHIDLGVCFESGRVLPIPEVVPFRLTRDLVDGMGYTKTEGVYRRCCEFTLEALREEVESIMTLLNVLRYDPLYSWTVSATKAKRMQEEDEDAEERGMNEARLADSSSRKKDDDMGEAGRALSVVEKKLSKTLSKEATVSELIAQATDERNLALLFCGWSAWV